MIPTKLVMVLEEVSAIFVPLTFSDLVCSFAARGH